MAQAVEGATTYQAYCGTCRVSQSFLTPQGMNYFRNEHEGHIVEIQQQTGGGETLEIVHPQAVERPTAVTPERKTPGGLDDGTSPETEELRRLAVDLVNNDGEDVFTIIGFSGDYHTFVRTFALTEQSEAVKFIEGGAHVDEYGNEYRWSANIVEPTPQAKGLLTRLHTSHSEKTAEPRESEEAQVEAKRPHPESSAAVVQAIVEDPLLLGKDSRLQEGDEYREAALKISNALREFRWNAEPPYVIGAIFDNIVSIQSQAGALSKEVIEKIEELGYRFVAVDAPKGRVTGWFKKVADPKEDRNAVYEPDAGELEFGDFRGAFSLGGKGSRLKKGDDVHR